MVYLSPTTVRQHSQILVALGSLATFTYILQKQTQVIFQGHSFDLIYKLVLESPCSTKSVPVEVSIQVLTDIRQKSVLQALAFENKSYTSSLFKTQAFFNTENLTQPLQ